MENNSKRILITGAGGFIGSYIVTAALERGYETWAAVRATTSREFLTDPRIHFIEIDFTSPEALATTLRDHVASHGPWHHVVHNLGATKCTNYFDFERINHGYLRLLVETLREINALPEHLVFISSLSVMGPGDEKGYTPFKSTDVPQPNTRYGTSKLKAETYLMMQSDVSYTVLRLTGVYGPHERDYYLMMKSIQRGMDFSVGFRKQMLTFIYVKDVAQAVMQALTHAPQRRTYFISEPRAYTQQEFRQLVCQQLGKRWVIPVTCPLWLVRMVCAIAEQWGKITLKPSTLNGDKFKILKQRNWLCDTAEAQHDIDFTAQYTLEQGLHEAIEWYRQTGWL
ncbi:MAG: NAD(P)-dependent oxidoreductase [Muribaculaceae bacterium]|nr:NAD(P)-dependent oxidoreductase [Muribaculaceae bacterium]